MTVRSCARRVAAALLVFLACKAVLVWHGSKYAWVFVDRTGIRYATVELPEFTESDRELRNPDRGFYRVYRFSITDNAVDYDAAIRDYFGWDRNSEPETEPSLTLVEVNLGNYRDGDISAAGLSNIDALLDANLVPCISPQLPTNRPWSVKMVSPCDRMAGPTCAMCPSTTFRSSGSRSRFSPSQS